MYFVFSLRRIAACLFVNLHGTLLVQAKRTLTVDFLESGAGDEDPWSIGDGAFLRLGKNDTSSSTSFRGNISSFPGRMRLARHPLSAGSANTSRRHTALASDRTNQLHARSFVESSVGSVRLEGLIDEPMRPKSTTVFLIGCVFSGMTAVLCCGMIFPAVCCEIKDSPPTLEAWFKTKPDMDEETLRPPDFAARPPAYSEASSVVGSVKSVSSHSERHRHRSDRRTHDAAHPKAQAKSTARGASGSGDAAGSGDSDPADLMLTGSSTSSFWSAEDCESRSHTRSAEDCESHHSAGYVSNHSADAVEHRHRAA